MRCIIKIVKRFNIWFIFVQMAESLDLTGKVFNIIAGPKGKGLHCTSKSLTNRAGFSKVTKRSQRVTLL
jgi:hypothetical protein